MSEEEKRKIGLNCYLDFYRAAVLYFKNPKDDNRMVFFDHGVMLLKALNLHGLVRKSEWLRKKLLQAGTPDIYLADDILTIGLLSKAV